MAELSTLARPYAQAVFQLAQDRNELATWSHRLHLLATIAVDPQTRVLLDDPRLARARLEGLFIEVAGEALDVMGRNLVRVLSENNRLALLAEIAAQYEILKAEAENTVQAELVAAQPVSEAKQAQICEALKKRLGREVELRCSIDERLIGGAVIRAGDLVIDGSALGRLERLAATLRT
jgi:F-type H+-transporting ATPase subunit delta